MNLTPAEGDERSLRARRMLREIGSVADQLAGLCHVAALAAVRGDFDDACDRLEEVLAVSEVLEARFMALLLPVGPQGRRAARASS